jgi:hypothetical protein
MRGNPGANGLARREESCVHPIPYACMSMLVGFMVGVWVVFCVVVCPVLGSCATVVKTGPEMPSNGATRSAYPSSCSGKGQ